MARDRWIYQERDVAEPWALHVWLLDNGTVDAAVYAEYLPSKSKKLLGIPATFDAFTDALRAILDESGNMLTVEDMKTLHTHWTRFAIDNKVI